MANDEAQRKIHRARLRCQALKGSIDEIHEQMLAQHAHPNAINNFYIAAMNVREAARRLELAEENLSNV
jgi:hypothetical protein